MRLLFLLAALALSASGAPAAQPSAVRADSIVAPVETTAEAGFLGTWWPALVLGLAGVAAVAGIALFVMKQRRDHDAATGGFVRTFNQSDPSPGRRTQTPAPLPGPSAAVEPLARQSDLEALAQRVARLEQQAAAPPPAPVTHAPAPSTPVPAAPPASASTASASEAAATAFAEWCRTGGGLVDRHELFQSLLDGAVPGAAVEVVRRDLDSPARPVYFDGVGGNSAAAYWLVRAGGEALLLPQPQSPQQFRDLAPVFEGTAAPQTVRQVVPARVAASGGGHVLTQPGRIG